MEKIAKIVGSLSTLAIYAALALSATGAFAQAAPSQATISPSTLYNLNPSCGGLDVFNPPHNLGDKSKFQISGSIPYCDQVKQGDIPSTIIAISENNPLTGFTFKTQLGSGKSNIATYANTNSNEYCLFWLSNQTPAWSFDVTTNPGDTLAFNYACGDDTVNIPVSITSSVKGINFGQAPFNQVQILSNGKVVDTLTINNQSIAVPVKDLVAGQSNTQMQFNCTMGDGTQVCDATPAAINFSGTQLSVDVSKYNVNLSLPAGIVMPNGLTTANTMAMLNIGGSSSSATNILLPWTTSGKASAKNNRNLKDSALAVMVPKIYAYNPLATETRVNLVCDKGSAYANCNPNTWSTVPNKDTALNAPSLSVTVANANEFDPNNLFGLYSDTSCTQPLAPAQKGGVNYSAIYLTPSLLNIAYNLGYTDSSGKYNGACAKGDTLANLNGSSRNFLTMQASLSDTSFYNYYNCQKPMLVYSKDQSTWSGVALPAGQQPAAPLHVALDGTSGPTSLPGLQAYVSCLSDGPYAANSNICPSFYAPTTAQPTQVAGNSTNLVSPNCIAASVNVPFAPPSGVNLTGINFSQAPFNQVIALNAQGQEVTPQQAKAPAITIANNNVNVPIQYLEAGATQIEYQCKIGDVQACDATPVPLPSASKVANALKVSRSKVYRVGDQQALSFAIGAHTTAFTLPANLVIPSNLPSTTPVININGNYFAYPWSSSARNLLATAKSKMRLGANNSVTVPLFYTVPQGSPATVPQINLFCDAGSSYSANSCYAGTWIATTSPLQLPILKVGVANANQFDANNLFGLYINTGNSSYTPLVPSQANGINTQAFLTPSILSQTYYLGYTDSSGKYSGAYVKASQSLQNINNQSVDYQPMQLSLDTSFYGKYDQCKPGLAYSDAQAQGGWAGVSLPPQSVPPTLAITLNGTNNYPVSSPGQQFFATCAATYTTDNVCPPYYGTQAATPTTAQNNTGVLTPPNCTPAGAVISFDQSLLQKLPGIDFTKAPFNQVVALDKNGNPVPPPQGVAPLTINSDYTVNVSMPYLEAGATQIEYQCNINNAQLCKPTAVPITDTVRKALMQRGGKVKLNQALTFTVDPINEVSVFFPEGTTVLGVYNDNVVNVTPTVRWGSTLLQPLGANTFAKFNKNEGELDLPLFYTIPNNGSTTVQINPYCDDTGCIANGWSNLVGTSAQTFASLPMTFGPSQTQVVPFFIPTLSPGYPFSGSNYAIYSDSKCTKLFVDPQPMVNTLKTNDIFNYSGLTLTPRILNMPLYFDYFYRDGSGNVTSANTCSAGATLNTIKSDGMNYQPITVNIQDTTGNFFKSCQASGKTAFLYQSNQQGIANYMPIAQAGPIKLITPAILSSHTLFSQLESQLLVSCAEPSGQMTFAQAQANGGCPPNYIPQGAIPIATVTQNGITVNTPVCAKNTFTININNVSGGSCFQGQNFLKLLINGQEQPSGSKWTLGADNVLTIMNTPVTSGQLVTWKLISSTGGLQCMSCCASGQLDPDGGTAAANFTCGGSQCFVPGVPTPAPAPKPQGKLIGGVPTPTPAPAPKPAPIGGKGTEAPVGGKAIVTPKPESQKQPMIGLANPAAADK